MVEQIFIARASIILPFNPGAAPLHQVTLFGSFMSATPASQRHISPPESNEEIDLLALFGSLLEHKFTVIAFTLLFAIGGAIYALLSTPIYMADTVIQVEDKKSTLAGMGEFADAFGTESGSNTEIELIKSRRVVGTAVEKLNLETIVKPEYLPIIGEAIARRNASSNPTQELQGIASILSGTWGALSNFFVNDDFAEQDKVRYAWGGEVLNLRRLTLPSNATSSTFTLIATGGKGFALYDNNNQLLCAGEAGTTITSPAGHEIYVDDIRARKGTRFILTQRSKLSTILSFQSRLSITERGKDSGILALRFEDKNPDLARRFLDVIANAYVRQNVERQSAEAARSLEFLKNQLPELKKNLERSEQELNRYQVEVGSVNISAEAEVVLNQVVEIESRIAELQLEKSEIDRKFTPDHPQYIAWQEQMRDLRERKAELDSRVRGLPKTQQEVLSLRRDLEVGTEIYTQMLNNIQELDIVRAGTVGNVRIIDEAVVNTASPVKPKKKMIVVVATMLGAALGIALVLVRSLLNRGVHSADDIETTGLPVYASIPESEKQSKFDSRVRRKNAHYPEGLLTWNDPTDIAIESLRSLRTSLHFAMLEAKNNVVVISGPSPGVGKSFIAGNLAAVIAQTGQRVLVVDTDLRRGYLHKMFNVEGTKGLSDILGKRASLDEAIQQTKVANLHVLPRGKAPPNPSELLMREEFTELMDQVAGEFDLVVVDTPPIMAVTDATIVAQHAGVTMLVVRYAKNPAKEIELCQRRCEQNGINLKGAILNAVERRGGVYGYRYGYQYYHYEYKPEGK